MEDEIKSFPFCEWAAVEGGIILVFLGCYFKTLSACDVCKASGFERVSSHSFVGALALRSPIHHIATIFLSNDRQQDDSV